MTVPKRTAAMVAALVTAAGLVASISTTDQAEADGAREAGVYDACRLANAEIRADALPESLDEDRCPVADRIIVDGGISAVVPEPGRSVTAFATGLDGSESLTVSNPRGDQLEVREDADAAPASPENMTDRAADLRPCADRARTMWDAKLYGYNRWYFATRTTPTYLSELQTLAAIERGGANVEGVHDSCGIPDRVEGRLIYEGATDRLGNIGAGGACGDNDSVSVVDFGDLPGDWTAFTCLWSWPQDGPDRVAQADVRLDSSGHRWTTRVGRSCEGRFDVESSVTHERGHHFGLGEVPERGHGNLTMSEDSNGPCQTSERSLGRGDALGFNAKY